MAVILEYLGRELLLPPGRFVVGRAEDCEIRLNDQRASRRHALLTVGLEDVHVEDLGSRNGVAVNGQPIDARQRLAQGDVVTIGRQQLQVRFEADPEIDGGRTLPSFDRKRFLFVWPQSSHPPPAAPAEPRYESPFALEAEDTATGVVFHPSPEAEREDDRLNALYLVGCVADKALARGKPEVAEESLRSVLTELIESARAGNELNPIAVDGAARYALRLANTMRAGKWVDYIFELYALQRRPLPFRLGDHLNTAAHKVDRIDMSRFEAYRAMLQARHLSPSAAERAAHDWIALKFGR